MPADFLRDAGEFTAHDARQRLDGVVIDAMDALSPKCGLIAEAVNRKLRVVTVGGCAGRLDGTRLKVTDLRDSRDDPLMMLVRKRLRQNFDFPRGKAPFGVSCVWSDEPFTQPTDCEGLPGGEIPEGEDLRPNCEWGYGTAAHVAGAFGLAAAGAAAKPRPVVAPMTHLRRFGLSPAARLADKIAIKDRFSPRINPYDR